MLPYETQEAILQLRKTGLSHREIAQRLGVSKTVVGKYCKRQHVVPDDSTARSVPGPDLGVLQDNTDLDGTAEITTADGFKTPREMMEACKLDPSRWVCESFVPNRWQSASADSPTGKVDLYQTKARFKQLLAPGIEEQLRALTRDCVAPARRLPKTRTSTGKPYALSWGVFDAHIGMYAWAEETENDYDLSIAANRIANSVDDMMEELVFYNIAHIWMPVGQDLYHFDTARYTTAFGDHRLDVDTRYAKVFVTGLRSICYMVERALELCDSIEIIYSPGNHDYTASYTLCLALQQRYRNDPRVSIDTSANPRKWRQHGGSLVMFDHGDKIKPTQYPVLMANECKSAWAEATYKEVQVGHLHQKAQREFNAVTPTNGVTLVRHPALCGTDMYHHARGWIGEPVKSVEARRFDETGFRGSHCVWAKDDLHLGLRED